MLCEGDGKGPQGVLETWYAVAEGLDGAGDGEADFKGEGGV